MYPEQSPVEVTKGEGERERRMRANENIIRCFSLASKVSVNSYGT